MRKAVTPEIHRSWSARSFTPIQTSQGTFDDVVCNIAYHFTKHGAKYGSVAELTQAARQYFDLHRQSAVAYAGLLRLPNKSLFEQDGRIVTFF